MPVLLLTGSRLIAIAAETILSERGHPVVRPRDVSDAVMVATSGNYCIVLIDPEYDNQMGNSVTKIIRCAERGDKHTLIIGLGVLRPGAKEYCAAVGMDDCIDMVCDQKLDELAFWLDVSRPPISTFTLESKNDCNL